MTLKQIEKEIRKLDPNLDPEDEAFDVAVVLLASAFIGPNADKLAEFTGRPRQKVREWGQRLRANGVWEGQKVSALGWTDDETGGLEFWLHTAVAQGLLQMRPVAA